MFLKSMGIQQQLITFIHSFIQTEKKISVGQFYHIGTTKTTTLFNRETQI